METEVRVPQASEGTSEDIETIPAPVSGILTKIVAAEGDTVDFGDLLGVITSAPSAKEAPSASSEQASSSDPMQSPSFSLPPLPSWGQNSWSRDPR